MELNSSTFAMTEWAAECSLTEQAAMNDAVRDLQQQGEMVKGVLVVHQLEDLPHLLAQLYPQGSAQRSAMEMWLQQFRLKVREGVLMLPVYLFMRSGFRGQANRNNITSSNNQQRVNGSSNSPAPHNSSSAPSLSNLLYSPGSNLGTENDSIDQTLEPESNKFFFRETYAKLGVKGNFLPLAAQPKHMDFAEWLAHHAHENYRMVAQVLECIQVVDDNTGEPICNPQTCPVMSAGRAHTYTWLNKNREPIRISAAAYIQMVQRWICGKLNDTKLFPTNSLAGAASDYASGGLNTPGSIAPNPMGPTTSDASPSTLAGRDWIGKKTGFPENYFNDLKTIFRQMFRLYAHCYHSHWVDPFWHYQSNNPPSSGWTSLNSLFVHFISVSKLFGLLSDRDMEPMQPLIDIWVANGSIPADAAAGACAVQPQQQQQ